MMNFKNRYSFRTYDRSEAIYYTWVKRCKIKAELARSHSATVGACIISSLELRDVLLEQLNVISKELRGSFKTIDEMTFILYTTRGDIESIIKQI